MMNTLFLGALLLLVAAAPVLAQDRMPAIPEDAMTDAQKQAVARFKAHRGQEPYGPYIPLLRSPEVMLRTMEMGDYLRYKTVLGNELNELVILTTARHFTQHYEWSAHYPYALKAGMPADVVKAISEGHRPLRMTPDQELVYDFTSELLQYRAVSDPTYARALARFGPQGTIDIVSVTGYYTYLAMVLNVARTAVTDPPPVPLKPLP